MHRKDSSDSYLISVDYGITVEEAIRFGNYDGVNENITQENFPSKINGKTEVEVELIDFKKIISTDNAFEEMDKMGYRPADLRELIVFGGEYSDLERGASIIAGPVWRDADGHRYSPCFYGSGSVKFLNLHRIDASLPHRLPRWAKIVHLFAAVRK